MIQRGREQGIVIRKFLENKSQEYFSFIDMVSKVPEKIVRRKGGFDANLLVKK